MDGEKRVKEVESDRQAWNEANKKTNRLKPRKMMKDCRSPMFHKERIWLFKKLTMKKKSIRKRFQIITKMLNNNVCVSLGG